MTKPTATGCYSKPVRLLAEMVSESAAFRTRVGGNLGWTRAQGIANLLDSTGAAKKIHLPVIDAFDYLAATTTALRGSTIAIVYTENGSSSFEVGGTRHYLQQQGALVLMLFATPLTEHNNNDEERSMDCGNFFGGVVEDIENLAALDDRLTVYSREDLQTCIPPSQLDKVGAKSEWWMNVTRWTWGSA